MTFANNITAAVIMVLLTLTGCNSSDNSATNADNSSQVVRLGEREFLLKVPQPYNENTPYPVIMAFHYSGGNADAMARITALDKIAEGYIVAYPKSAVEEWNEGCGCNKPDRLGIDDVAFVDEILAHLKSGYNINPDRIFAAGYSQGGLFVQNLACKRSEVFRAVAVVSAPMSEQLADSCQPTSPISIIMIHAEDDAVLPFYGQVHSNFGLISSIDAAIFWAAHNQLQLDSTWQFLSDNIRLRSSDGTDYKVKLFSPLKGGHAWNFSGLNSSEVVLDFFAEH